MATINYRIKSKENKEVSIYVYFRPSGSPVISAKTSYTVNPKNWSKSKKRAKASDPHLHNLNISLDNLVTFLSQSLNYDNQQGVEIDNKWLKKKVDEFNNKVPVSDNSYLLNFLDLSIERLDLKRANDGSQGLKKSTIKGYNTFRNILMSYEEAIGSKIRFNGLDKGFIDDFFKWLVEEKKYAKSQSSRLMKRLKKLLKEAQVEGITISINPDLIGREYIFKPEKIINVITEEDFIKLIDLKGLPNYLENARKWILIGLMTGQRVSDLLNIKKDMIRFEKENLAMIDIVQQKTKTHVTIPVENHYVLNILKSKPPHKISDQRFNEYMKEVFKRAGIDNEISGYKRNKETNRKELMKGPKYEFVTSHDLRRSYASYFYDKNVPVNLIMKITGHKMESDFYTYIGRNPNKDYDAYNFLKALR
ncbi:tyrosine-type recombinase/integrase [Flavobacteriaceae bacterium]|nr:tyrosine-type recombinase/integrase [Flavobacteriaceae bacterium]MDC1057018.1 tyrosine-type recombinase/integrase [Flavobacteriaceae bacterium]